MRENLIQLKQLLNMLDLTQNYHLIRQIEIKDYLTHVQMSAQRRPQYYKKAKGSDPWKKIPKKYQTPGYRFDSKGFLIDSIGMKIISNPKSVGTPKYAKINTQLIYAGGGQAFLLRSKIMKVMKAFFTPYIQKIKPIQSEQFPIKLRLEFHTYIETGNWDLDNHSWIYTKAIQDVMQDQGIIPEDNIQTISHVEFVFVPVTQDKDRKIDLKIYALKP